MITFGPIPSRRLGRSLGVNHIPPKACSYSCVYCQVGRTSHLRVVRRAFYDPAQVEQAVREHLAQARSAGERVDYLSFVPDGEPTLDVHLGAEIARLRPLGTPIAVITNGSLLWRQDVRNDLLLADWVSVKVDSVQEDVWRRVDRPHGKLRLPVILDGMLEFARQYRGLLVTETMLVAGVNDDERSLEAVADFLAHLGPSAAYISVPTRPPAEAWVRPPDGEVIVRAYAIFREKVERVELLTGYEGNAFALIGDPAEDLLRITAVHPLREDALVAYLARSNQNRNLVDRLLAQGLLIEIEYRGQRFYRRATG